MEPTRNILEILKTLKFPQPTVVVEIGAADGKDTPLIMEAIGECRYFAFEPDSRNIATIKESEIYYNPQYRLFECAVGDRNGVATFHTSRGFNTNLNCEHSFSGSLKKAVKHLERHPWCVFDNDTTVNIVKLDEFKNTMALTEIGLIWCDVQGAEDLVIAGGQEAFAVTRYFYTEYDPEELYEGQLNEEQIQERLPGKWEVVEKWQDNVLFKNLAFA